MVTIMDKKNYRPACAVDAEEAGGAAATPDCGADPGTSCGATCNNSNVVRLDCRANDCCGVQHVMHTVLYLKPEGE